MWCDTFDADLLAVVPGALDALGDTAGVRLLTYSTLTGGKINHPATWNGPGALFWTSPDHQPDAFWATSKPVAECTFAEAVRDEWVHSCTININGTAIWEPPARLMERLMYDLRGWRPLDDTEREHIRGNVRASLTAAAARLTALLGRPAMTGIPAAERDGVVQLPRRSVLYSRLLVVDGKPAVEIACDCAMVTQHVIDPDPQASIAEIPLTCDGCTTTRWITLAIRTATDG